MKKFTALAVLVAALSAAVAILVPGATAFGACSPDTGSPSITITVPLSCTVFTRGSTVNVLASFAPAAPAPTSVSCTISVGGSTTGMLSATKQSNGTWRCNAGLVIMQAGSVAVTVTYFYGLGPDTKTRWIQGI